MIDSWFMIIKWLPDLMVHACMRGPTHQTSNYLNAHLFGHVVSDNLGTIIMIKPCSRIASLCDLLCLCFLTGEFPMQWYDLLLTTRQTSQTGWCLVQQ